PRAIDGGGWSERPVVLDTPRGRLVAVACEPPAARRPGDWVLFLNSGRVRRIGPNRLVTSYARAWARLGVPSLRLDLGGIGDSDGEPADDEVPADYDEAWYYRSRFDDDVRDTLDFLARDAAATRFAIIGLCSAATWALKAALVDERTAGAALVNPRVLLPDPRGRPLRAWARMRGTLVRPWLWPGLRGQGVRTLVADAARGAGLAVTGRGDPAWQRELVLDALGRLRPRRTTLSMIFTAGDAGIEYLERHLGSGYRSVLEAHGVTFDVVAGPDHTFRPLWSHAVLRGLLERHLAATGFLDEHVADAA